MTLPTLARLGAAARSAWAYVLHGAGVVGSLALVALGDAFARPAAVVCGTAAASIFFLGFLRDRQGRRLLLRARPVLWYALAAAAMAVVGICEEPPVPLLP